MFLSVAFTNHGSYGTVPGEVFSERVRLLTVAEAHPDRWSSQHHSETISPNSRWFRTTLRPLYDSALNDVAKFVGADPNNLVFVQVLIQGVLK